MLYCYIDLDDGSEFESPVHGLENTENVKRDYRRENVGIGPAIGSINRDMKASETRDLFLPTRKDFERIHGERGADKAIKNWNDHHEPQAAGGGKYRPK